ncbi:MAG: FAD-binding oxidoreductase [Chloroflexota bacterium]
MKQSVTGEKLRTHAVENKRKIELAQYLIIGKGLFGSAAARHLAHEGQNVVLVGADEPVDWSVHTGVFASHYDEARIVSQSAPDEVLEQLDQASIAVYDEIERESGILFFSPTGRLTAQPSAEPIIYPYLASDAPCRHGLTSKQSEAHYPFRFPPNYTIIYEDAPSGYLNPRAMVRAQISSAQKRGAQVISALVTEVHDCSSHVEARLADGRVISAEKVLIATGAFANCFGLLKQKLAIRAETLTTVLCEVSAKTAAQYAHLPPLNYQHKDSPLVDISVLPPLSYADGQHYIKLSLTSSADTLLPDFAAMSNWFRITTKTIPAKAITEKAITAKTIPTQTDRTFPYLEETKRLMARLMPSIEILSWQTKPCIIAFTPSFKPMIDCLVDGRIYVALGGNAGSAHPSDAIGRLAADLMRHNSWQSQLDHVPFQLQFSSDWHEWMTEQRSVIDRDN